MGDQHEETELDSEPLQSTLERQHLSNDKRVHRNVLITSEKSSNLIVT